MAQLQQKLQRSRPTCVAATLAARVCLSRSSAILAVWAATIPTIRLLVSLGHAAPRYAVLRAAQMQPVCSGGWTCPCQRQARSTTVPTVRCAAGLSMAQMPARGRLSTVAVLQAATPVPLVVSRHRHLRRHLRRQRSRFPPWRRSACFGSWRWSTRCICSHSATIRAHTTRCVWGLAATYHSSPDHCHRRLLHKVARRLQNGMLALWCTCHSMAPTRPVMEA